MDEPFTSHRAAALAILTAGVSLREKEGNFLGGVAYRVDPISEKQANWLRILLDRHGLPGLSNGGGDER